MCKLFIRTIIILMVAASFSCQTKKEECGVNHVVLCWLKDKSAGTMQTFLASVDSLKSIPAVQSISHGKTVQSVEPVADNSFDVGFIVKFKDKAGLDSYLVHPDHLKAVEEVLKPSLKKVIVYDFESN